MIQLSLPEDIFFPLFQDLAMSVILDDGKSLADAIPLFEPIVILENYLSSKHDPNFDLKAFFVQNFKVQGPVEASAIGHQRMPILEHLSALWDHLYRPTSVSVPGSTLITLPYPYIVPGGRFNEIYYWDSYFTMLGLKVSGKFDIIESMINNFAWMVDHIGFIPNGNRTYFLSRSQPPFFSLIVALLADEKGDHIYTKYITHLEKEYAWWMKQGDDQVQHLALLDDETKLNRYYDLLETPRTEMYLADTHLSQDMDEGHKKSFYGHIRAACESGWDFSSRWCSDPLDLDTIETLNVLPVDLNCLLCNLEKTLAKAYLISGNDEKHVLYLQYSNERAAMINHYFWNEESGYYFDYHFKNRKQTHSIHASGLFPLFINLASPEQGARALDFVQKNLLKEGGIVTSTVHSGQQWDAPNGWAPLQWIAFRSAQNYHHDDFANEIGKRWLALNEKVYQSTGKMMEKYNVEDLTLLSGGGEYPVQDGFGWTNGVYLAMDDAMKIL
jgi:alpha,alpha-trehalase